MVRYLHGMLEHSSKGQPCRLSDAYFPQIFNIVQDGDQQDCRAAPQYRRALDAVAGNGWHTAQSERPGAAATTRLSAKVCMMTPQTPVGTNCPTVSMLVGIAQRPQRPRSQHPGPIDPWKLGRLSAK